MGINGDPGLGLGFLGLVEAKTAAAVAATILAAGRRGWQAGSAIRAIDADEFHGVPIGDRDYATNSNRRVARPETTRLASDTGTGDHLERPPP
jgi:hypothetical protein